LAAPVPANAPVPAADDKKAAEAPADVEGRLLMHLKVLKDMKCDMDQFDRIMDVMEAAEKAAQQKTGEAMGQLKFNVAPGGPPPNAEAIQKMIQDAQEAGEKEFRKAVGTVMKDVLTPAQRKRFQEIDLQARGHEAFTTPTVIKALDITAKQKEQFEGNARQVEEDITQAFQKPLPAQPLPAGPPGVVVGFAGFGPGDYEKVVRDARAEGLKRALAILTDEQKAGWKKLTGEPFTHPLPIHFGGPKTGIRFGGGGFGIGGGGRVVPAMPAVPAVPLLPAGPPVKIAPGGAQTLPAKPPAPNM
jgi:Spy/CpxP family protein refolding chaperone